MEMTTPVQPEVSATETAPSDASPEAAVTADEAVFHRWLSGIPYEVAFWKSYYGSRRRRADLFSWSKFGQECEVEGFDIQSFLRGCGDPSPRLLDVGSALSYTFGNMAGGRPLDVAYVDPLAPFYNRILRRYNIDRPDITFGMVEGLSMTFGRDSVNFIHVRNALDHSSDPAAGLIQCLLTIKEGGVVYLNHFANEAERENYRGFHQYNISLSPDGHLHFWNPEGDIDITTLCHGFAQVETLTTPEGRVVAILKKTAPVPATLADDRRTALRMAERTISTISYFHTAPRAARYQWRRLVTTAGHRFMRLLPYSLLNRIKQFAAKK